MTTYRERREARAERLRGWADKRDDKAGAAFAGVQKLADAIPFGQPILVGHHSEKHARRDQDRIHNGMSRGVEHSRKAEDMRAKADNIERAAAHAIYSDDPDAVEALQAKIDRLEAERGRLKAYNASCRARKAAGDTSLLDDKQREDLLVLARVASFQLGKYGEFPSYASSNIGGVITATRKRLEVLTRTAAQADATTGYTAVCVALVAEFPGLDALTIFAAIEAQIDAGILHDDASEPRFTALEIDAIRGHLRDFDVDEGLTQA